MAAAPNIRVLIADDEPGARRRLERLLKTAPDVDVVGQVGSGEAAVQAIRQQNPDLVFLDVQMPGLTGIDVVKAVGPDAMPPVVFVTAYDQYAVKAFDLAALDYLLKPFDDERFEQALARSRAYLSRSSTDTLQDRLRTLLQALETPEPVASTPYLERIAVEKRGQLQIIPLDTISYFSASGNYVYLHVGEEKLLIREQMQRLEEHLPPDRFFRIHRSYIVRLEEIATLVYSAGGEYKVRLSNGEVIKASRSRWGTLAQRLGIQTSHWDDNS